MPKPFHAVTLAACAIVLVALGAVSGNLSLVAIAASIGAVAWHAASNL